MKESYAEKTIIKHWKIVCMECTYKGSGCFLNVELIRKNLLRVFRNLKNLQVQLLSRADPKIYYISLKPLIKFLIN